LDTAVPALRDRSTWCCALLQLPGQPSCSPPWGTCSHVVESAQPPPPPCGGPHSCADPRGVASGCCYRLRVLMSPRAHRAGTPAPSEPRWTLPAVEVDRPPLPAPGRCAAAPRRHPRSLRANASPGQLARLPRPLSAQPRLLPAVHRNPPWPLLVSAKPQISSATEPACTPLQPPCSQLSSRRMGR
jgi:hypothetical protein